MPFEIIILISAFIFFIFSVIFLIKKRNQKLEIEMNKVPIYKELCNGRFDPLGFLDIFHKHVLTTRLSLYDDFVVISYRKKILLEYNDIEKLEIAGTKNVNPQKAEHEWKRLIIHHNKKNVSRKIYLYLSDCEKIKEFIENKMSK